MSKKTLNVQAITNELEQSLYFRKSEPPPLPEQSEEKPVMEVEKVHRRTSAKVHQREGATVQHRTSAPISQNRQKKKQGFQVYADQAFSLAKLQFQQFQKTGTKPDIGEFVRQALDDFITKKKRELEG